MTYSIVARDPETGDLGVAVQTHQVGVGWMVPWLLPGLGAIATQSLVNISFGHMGLAMLKGGTPAPKVVEGLVTSDSSPDGRQVAVVDPEGKVGAWTGPGCIPEAGHHIGDGYSVQANMMTNDGVIPAMRNAFENSTGRFPNRLFSALEAAEAQGGDIRGKQSAAMKIVVGDPVKALKVNDWESIYDLRVDEHADPLLELDKLIRFRTSQIITEEGEATLERGDHEAGLQLFHKARELAPELEENGFWQAMVLADNYGDYQNAAQILHEVFEDDPRRANWLELVERLQACGLMDNEGVDKKILDTLTELKAQS